MKILTHWLRTYLPVLNVDDAQLAQDLTLRGIAVEGVFELSDSAGDSEGALFDMDITTNRVDAMNHYGIAREAAAIYNVALHPLQTSLPAPNPAGAPNGPRQRSRPEAMHACGRLHRAGQSTASPSRPASRIPSRTTLPAARPEADLKRSRHHQLRSARDGPAHARVRSRQAGWRRITVRLRARGRSSCKSARWHHPNAGAAQDLVIADDVKAVSLAGVMGGHDTMITAETRNILVESAWFDPAAIRATSLDAT